MDEIYEVPRDDYVGFFDQIKPACRRTEKDENGDYTFLRTYSTKTNKLLCLRMIPKLDDLEEHFYVYEMPDDDERRAGRPRRKLILSTQEEVQAFFDILAKVQNKND